jgi:hypothetical protein
MNLDPQVDFKSRMSDVRRAAAFLRRLGFEIARELGQSRARTLAAGDAEEGALATTPTTMA